MHDRFCVRAGFINGLQNVFLERCLTLVYLRSIGVSKCQAFGLDGRSDVLEVGYRQPDGMSGFEDFFRIQSARSKSKSIQKHAIE